MIRGNKAMKKLFAILICAIMCVTLLASCDSLKHEHTYGDWISSEDGHFHPYTCGCPQEEIYNLHIDGNEDGLCDECGYKMSVNAESSLEYKLLGDGTYEVKGIGTCTDTEIVIPSEYQNRKVTSIGYRAFANNSTITGVTIPDSIKSIGEEAFYKCTELTGIVIPDSVTSLGKSAFYECTKLVSLTLGKGIKTISASTFSDCTALASIVIPDGVTTIETNAFNHCEGARSVTIPKSVTEIASTAFSYTYSVESFIVAEDNTSYIAIDGALFTKDKTKLHQYPLGSTLKSFVPCTSIGGTQA